MTFDVASDVPGSSELVGSVMNKRILVLMLSATAVSSVGAASQIPQPAEEPHNASAATALSVRGTIDTYDASTRTLSLSTTNGTVRLSMTSTTRIRQGWHKVDALDLPKLAGDRATVRYTESSGNRVAQSIHVFGK
jgi:hypothetical protein